MAGTFFNGTISFQDVKTKRASMGFYGVDSLAKLETLANALGNMSCAKAAQVTIAEHKKYTPTSSAIEGKWDSVNDKAMIILEDLGTGRTSKYLLPAPLESLMTHDVKSGYVMKETQGNMFASEVSTATGRTMRFVKGSHIANKTKSQA